MLPFAVPIISCYAIGDGDFSGHFFKTISNYNSAHSISVAVMDERLYAAAADDWRSNR